MIRKLTSCLAVLPLIATLTAAAEPTLDPSGSWRWTDEYGVQSVLILDLPRDGNLEGIYRGHGAGDAEIKNGRIKGRELTMEIDLVVDGGKVHSELSCSIKGDKMEGESEYSGDLGDGVTRFSAERKVIPQDVVGKWELKFTTPDGLSQTAVLEVKAEGKEFDCIYTSGEGVKLPVVSSELKGNEFSFYMEPEHNGQTVEVTAKGHPYGDRFKGVFTYDFEGNTGEFTFRGKRSSD